MIRTLVVTTVACLNLTGCQAIAEIQAEQAARRQAIEDNLRARIEQLTPQQRDAVQQCSSMAAGRINALRNAGQGGGTNGINDYTVADACLSNPYYYETIPAPAVVVNVPPPTAPNPYPIASLPSQNTMNCTTTRNGNTANTTCN
jgi:hypothetical protein